MQNLKDSTNGKITDLQKGLRTDPVKSPRYIDAREKFAYEQEPYAHSHAVVHRVLVMNLHITLLSYALGP